MNSAKRSRPALHDRLLSFVLRGLKRLGVGIEFYFVTREGDYAEDLAGHGNLLTTGFLERRDAESIASVKYGGSLDETLRWFEEGKLCFGVKDGSRIVAKMWCDLEAFHFPPEYRHLDRDEAYFFAAAVSEQYRGQNLAPLMRLKCADALLERGRTRIWSYTEYFNKPARRFKEKLGCRHQALRLHVNLFNRFRRTWTIKEYS